MYIYIYIYNNDNNSNNRSTPTGFGTGSTTTAGSASPRSCCTTWTARSGHCIMLIVYSTIQLRGQIDGQPVHISIALICPLPRLHSQGKQYIVLCDSIS